MLLSLCHHARVNAIHILYIKSQRLISVWRNHASVCLSPPACPKDTDSNLLSSPSPNNNCTAHEVSHFISIQIKFPQGKKEWCVLSLWRCFPFASILKQMLMNFNIPSASQRQDCPVPPSQLIYFSSVSFSPETSIAPLSDNRWWSKWENASDGKKKDKNEVLRLS